MKLIVEKDYKEMSKYAAEYIKSRINSKDGIFVLGLPTGSTPLMTYEFLIKFYEEGQLSFKNTVTFNMDEYVGLPEDHPQSYHAFMYNNFFRHIDIPACNINILNGNTHDYEKECSMYEKKIEKSGGIDLFMGGIGENGHIAFNEPYSSFDSVTGIRELSYDTRAVNSRFFNNDIGSVPGYALSVGIKTVMSANEVMILASGVKKAKALREVFKGPVTEACPASVLNNHEKAFVVCDEEAASLL